MIECKAEKVKRKSDIRYQREDSQMPVKSQFLEPGMFSSTRYKNRQRSSYMYQ